MEHNNSYGYLTDCREVSITFPPQHQDRQLGLESVMDRSRSRNAESPAGSWRAKPR